MTTNGESLALASGDALFLDFDGTLAGLQDNPETVWLAPGLDDVLISCAEKLNGALAIVSGRDVEDLSKRVPETLWRFGNHGLRAAPPGSPPTPSPSTAPEALQTELASAVSGHDGLRIEPKGAVLAVHYRADPSAATWLPEAVDKIVSAYPDYKLQHGKMVLEAKPSAANKGRCLSDAMTRPPFQNRRPIMIGDDTTDEDAFAAAQTLGGLAIKVGDGTTIADYRVKDTFAVHELLKDFQTR